MIELVIVACLMSAPDHCRPHILGSPGTVQACTASSMLTVARWAGHHPAWQVKRFECRAFERQA